MEYKNITDMNFLFCGLSYISIYLFNSYWKININNNILQSILLNSPISLNFDISNLNILNNNYEEFIYINNNFFSKQNISKINSLLYLFITIL